LAVEYCWFWVAGGPLEATVVDVVATTVVVVVAAVVLVTAAVVEVVTVEVVVADDAECE
jgi:hypothetical protein